MNAYISDIAILRFAMKVKVKTQSDNLYSLELHSKQAFEFSLKAFLSSAQIRDIKLEVQKQDPAIDINKFRILYQVRVSASEL